MSLSDKSEVKVKTKKEEGTEPKMKRAATQKRHITLPMAEIKPCNIYSSAAYSIVRPSLDDLQDSDEEDCSYNTQHNKKKKRPTRRNKKPSRGVYFDSDDDDFRCNGERTPSKKTSSTVSLDSPCSPPPPPDLGSPMQRPLAHDKVTSHLLRKINVTLTNVRCVQNEFSSDDAFSPLSRTPRGSLSVIDIDAPQPPRTRNSITVKVRSKFGLHRYQLAMTESFSTIITEIAELEGASRDCVKLTRVGHDKEITEFDTPQSINLHIADIIDCLIVDPPSLPGSQDTVEVTLQGMEKNSSMTTITSRTDPLERIMAEYSTFCGHPVAKLRFSFDGETIKPSDTPELLDFEEDTNMIDVHILR
ncbi:NFATC2-interacting protein-like isoform X1 [Asterias rubens]|uniref:NFATC2-interacting protein-like isoform X1 n=1 Tax=Asterias rubens TaxID=7604 RepID=UPI0014557169|nr:NFATC2-interacting protein-like isoform X1 [Asterias rubens]